MAPLRSNNVSAHSSVPSTCETTPGTTQRPKISRTSSDPRARAALSARDHLVLVFIALAREVAQYHLHALFFAGKSEVALSRCVRRLAGLGLITIYRWRKVGINRLRLTVAGADYIREHDLAPESQIYVAARPTADKDVAHALWIVDLLVLYRIFAPAIDALPCWHARRTLGTKAGVSIPDLLAVPKRPGAPLVAIEVDRATERLRIVVEKLQALDTTLAALAADAPATILFLTIGARRVLAIEKALTHLNLRAAVVVAELPKDPGRPGLAALARQVFQKDFSATDRGAK